LRAAPPRSRAYSSASTRRPATPAWTTRS
jgi:hypothetical protein